VSEERVFDDDPNLTARARLKYVLKDIQDTFEVVEQDNDFLLLVLMHVLQVFGQIARGSVQDGGRLIAHIEEVLRRKHVLKRVQILEAKQRLTGNHAELKPFVAIEPAVVELMDRTAQVIESLGNAGADVFRNDDDSESAREFRGAWIVARHVLEDLNAVVKEFKK